MSLHTAGQLLADTENSNPKMTPIWHRKMKFYRLLKPFPAWAEGADCWLRCAWRLWPPSLVCLWGCPTYFPSPQVWESKWIHEGWGARSPGNKVSTHRRKRESVDTSLLLCDGFDQTGKSRMGHGSRPYLNFMHPLLLPIKHPQVVDDHNLWYHRNRDRYLESTPPCSPVQCTAVVGFKNNI